MPTKTPRFSYLSPELEQQYKNFLDETDEYLYFDICSFTFNCGVAEFGSFSPFLTKDQFIERLHNTRRELISSKYALAFLSFNENQIKKLPWMRQFLVKEVGAKEIFVGTNPNTKRKIYVYSRQ